MLFDAIELRGLVVGNRIVASPVSQYSSENGCATDWHLASLGSMSMGAAGVVVTEQTSVSAEGKQTPKCPTLCSDENEWALRRVVEFCKQFGVAAQSIQLSHAGRLCAAHAPLQGGGALRDDEGAWQRVAPSAVSYGPTWPLPRPLARSDMHAIREDFEAAVGRVVRTGYDLLELQMGRGQLLHQFLSPLSNRRTDGFGGGLMNRMRFPLEVFHAMRYAWPSDKPMGVCVPVTDWFSDGWQFSDALHLIAELKRLGCDYVHITSGGLDSREVVPRRRGYQVQFSNDIKKTSCVRTMVGGRVKAPAYANEIITGGHADFVCIGRGVMWNPRWAWHAAQELGQETAFPLRAIACQPSMSA